MVLLLLLVLGSVVLIILQAFYTYLKKFLVSGHKVLNYLKIPKFLIYGFSTDINRDGTVVVIGVNGDDLPEIVGSNDNNYGSSIVYNYNAVSNS